MPATPFESNESPALPPFPEGWYFVASREEIRRKKIIHKTWLGEEIVLWCDEEERICMAEAFCPHMGAFLAPKAGARVCNGRLVCPFHGFEYVTNGQCVATPYAPPPASARLNVYETTELEGMLFAWWGIGGRRAQWQLPEESQQLEGWSNIRQRTIRIPGHPQETTENSVDLAHLRYVHGYENVQRTAKLMIDGEYLRSCFEFKARIRIAGPLNTTFDVATVTHVHGLGYSQVDFHERSIGYRARLWVLSTPVDGTSIDLTLASRVGDMRRPKRAVFGFRFLPLRARVDLMNRLVLAKEAGYVAQDVVVWSRKRFLPRPRLNRADGEILAYRRYCDQFYGSERVSTPKLIVGRA